MRTAVFSDTYNLEPLAGTVTVFNGTAPPTQPPAPQNLQVDSQRNATWTPASGTSPSDYEYQFTPAAPQNLTVDNQRNASFTPAPGASATDYEYQLS